MVGWGMLVSPFPSVRLGIVSGFVQRMSCELLNFLEPNLLTYCRNIWFNACWVSVSKVLHGIQDL